MEGIMGSPGGCTVKIFGKTMNKKEIILLLAVAGVMAAGCHHSASLPYYTSADFTPVWEANKLTSTLHAIPDFSFIDQDNKTVTSQTFGNKIYIANFFFTSCGSVCPKMTKNLLKVQKAFPGVELGIISHSVTPWIDSVPRLKEYAERFGLDSRWHLVTGDKQSIYQLARHGYFAGEQAGFTKDSTEFLHTEHVLLVDKKKHIRGVYNGTLELEINRLIDDINLLLKEDRF
jgi:protein SCO1